MKTTRRILKTALVLSLSLFIAIFSSHASALAALLPFTQADLDQVRMRQYYRDPNEQPCGTQSVPASASGAGGRVYMLGDSITVGATPALQTALAANGMAVQKINGFVGRSITTPGEGGNETGLQAIDNDAIDITAANIVVVALGTNGANEQGVTDIIAKIKTVNASARIFWVNVFSPGAAAKDAFNQTITNLATSEGFTVIDTTAANIAVRGDGLHPTAEGQQTFAQTVALALSGNVSTNPVGSCSCSLSTATNGTNEENERQVWAYFTGTKSLSPEAAAGLMGSIAPESGFDPHNTQNTAPAPDGPEIPIDVIRGRWGYGLIQWTSAGRQDNLVAYARETNRSTGDLGLQLDFLWKELSESYAGTLTTLQTPSITVQEASDEVTLHFVTPGSVTREHGTADSRAATLRARGAASQGFFDKYSGQTLSYSGGTGCTSNGTNIDLVSQDTTNISCGGNTQDAGTADGYRAGKLHKIRLCTVGGTRVNSQISGSIERLLADATSVDLTLDGAGGSFRDMQGQISTYLRHCASRGIPPTPAPYPKANWSDYTRCPGAAPPGYSNHQMGLGFDFVCNGALIPEAYADAQSNPCFQWLQANASKYGLYEYGKGESRNEIGYEGWHWSVDGD